MQRTLPLYAAVLVAALTAPASAAANSVNAQETVSAGSLSFINGTPGPITFPGVTLNGNAPVSVTQSQPLDVDDATGSGAGWNITADGTQFSNGNATLPTGAVTMTGLAQAEACDSGVSCSTASNSITYPLTLPVGTNPTPIKIYDAGTGSGMADQTVTPLWTLTVPANAAAGTYTSTWTLSLASMP